MLHELNRIYREREEQYRKWNLDYEEKSKKLDEKLAALSTGRKEISDRERKLKAEKDELDKREKELNAREMEFSQLYADLEKARSEVLQLKKDAEDYKFDCAMQEESLEDRERDLSQYILRSEHEKIVDDMRQTIDALREERIHLLKNSLGMQEVTEHADVKGEEYRMTASLLKQYLEHSSESGKVEITRTDDIEELKFERNGIMYSFLFSVPPAFKIVTESISQEQRAEIGQKYPEIQVTTKDDRVILIGYFTEDITADILAERVFAIGKCLTNMEERI